MKMSWYVPLVTCVALGLVAAPLFAQNAAGDRQGASPGPDEGVPANQLREPGEDNPPQSEPAAGQPTTQEAPDRVLYVVATAHLDTQWLWTIQDTIDKFIPRTLHDNFALFEKYPNYVFSFEGAFRYRLMKEYYPEDYAKLKDYVAKGRWHVCGSSVDAGDVNTPSPESLIRHILYGNRFFQQEFGKTSCDIFLPDCFGFGYALPSVAAHCGLKGFSSQKLTWGGWVGIPFEKVALEDADGKKREVSVGLGVWEGVDGSTLIVCLNPGDYVSKIREDLSQSKEWIARTDDIGGQTGAYVGYKYFGVGDEGGAPDDESVAWLEKSIAGQGPVRVISAAADQLYRDLTPQQIAKLPRYKGELLMTRHGVGCYTSQAAMKRWNRKNEQLADAAERAAVVADWLGGAVYPKAKLTEAWTRFLWHQFHDDLTGTSIPQAYCFSWNDEAVAANQFAEVLTDSVGAVARALDTRAEGVPLVVFNPLSLDRKDVVEATVRFADQAPSAVRVFSGKGKEVPSQIVWRGKKEIGLLFVANVPSVGFAVYDVRPAETDAPAPARGKLKASPTGLENSRYRVQIDENGDIAGIYDKELDKELLAGPIRWQLLSDTSSVWPEWEIMYEDVMAPPLGFVGGPCKVRVVESGPVRVAVEIERHVGDSTFVQCVRLAAGLAGDRVEVDARLDWRHEQTLLKAAFPLAASNEKATYDLGLGAIERGNNKPELYEVPAQQWADITNADGEFGVTVSSDCKYGWDKPNDNTLRLTLIHNPGNVQKDMGHHRFSYTVCGHSLDWSYAGAPWLGAVLNQPLSAFQTKPHDGPLGRRLSMLILVWPDFAVQAFKKAEEGDEVVVRLQGAADELVRLVFPAAVAQARNLTGAEESADPGDLVIKNGWLWVSNLKPYHPRTVAVRLGEPPARLSPPVCRPVPLPFDADVVSADGAKTDGDFDGAGHTLPGELLPAKVVAEGITFEIGPTTPGAKNAVVCRGQKVDLPAGKYGRLYLLAAAAGGDTSGVFKLGDNAAELRIQNFTGFVGQSQSLVVGGKLVNNAQMDEPFIKTDSIAWVGTHRHAADGRNEAHVCCYLFKYALDVPAGAKSVTLPDNDKIRVLAMTLADNPNGDTIPAADLYDHVDTVRIRPRGGLTIDPVTVEMSTDIPGAEIRYTLDGSEPSASSKKYDAPLEMKQNATVKARAFVDGRAGNFVARRSFTFTTLRKPENPEGVVSGVAYECFEGKWRKLAEMEGAAPAKTGVADKFDTTPRTRDTNFGLRFNGYLDVPRDGIYTFYLGSDDGSRLLIGSAVVIDNDGLHGNEERTGQIALAAGRHAVTVLYFQGGGNHDLEVSHAGPDLPKQQIPPSALFREKTAEEKSPTSSSTAPTSQVAP
jgi:alpha-mannosidase